VEQKWLTKPNNEEKSFNRKPNLPQMWFVCQTYTNGGPVQVSRILKDETDMYCQTLDMDTSKLKKRTLHCYF
jgi:hypothetical protein